MKTFLLLMAITLVPQFFQDKLPEFGELADLKGMKRVYVTADTTDARNLILKELKGSALEVVGSAENADFILECIQKGETSGSGLIAEIPTYEMTIYTLKSDRRRIAWSKTKTSVRPAPKLLTGDFLGALKKLK